MRKTLLFITLFGALVLLPACKPSNRVDFKPSLISVDPGAGWVRLDIPSALPACTPRLMGKAGMINAVLLQDFTDVKKAADYLQSSFAANEKAVPGSFKQEEFATDYREPGVHLSYTGQSPKSTTPDLRSHSFITRNRNGRCVSISYITSPVDESAAVLEAIRKSIRVE